MKSVAYLSNQNNFTVFTYSDYVIRFLTSHHLIKYTKILEWDNGYLVVMAKYDNSSIEEEEYIDLIPILKNLYIEPEKFLSGIKEVLLKYE